MNIKRFLLINSMALSLLGASIASAQPPASGAATSTNQSQQYHHSMNKILTPQQRVELVKIKKNLRAQMLPLIKEKRALSLQIRGKIATPDAKWSDISSLLEKRNAVELKISTLLAKTQLQTYQKMGILLPIHHRHHYCHGQNKNMAKK
ncbi:hypothetical protein [Legionella cincinnatiensis]|uniref:Zinc resistance-associated protein n=1 Tax=Legionella cincinnatiensis TaxID=28085 RepID=A0A378ILT3_9GAMM|nr:hypothetical protein [Legionella cincinnatiensis]KTC83915.1 hypothetical protein Lcin_1995 [Legionella cincinnatiensis]STX36207.1 Uncharacterised protein [Legionella cincinnatiensis]